MLEKSLESPLDYREIQPVHPKDQSWVFIGRTYVFGHLMQRTDSFEKTLMLGKIVCVPSRFQSVQFSHSFVSDSL